MFSYFCTKFHQIFVIQSSLVDTKMTILQVWTCWGSIRYSHNPGDRPAYMAGRVPPGSDPPPDNDVKYGEILSRKGKIFKTLPPDNIDCLLSMRWQSKVNTWKCHLCRWAPCCCRAGLPDRYTSFSHRSTVELHVVVEPACLQFLVLRKKHGPLILPCKTPIIAWAWLENDGVIILSHFSHFEPLQLTQWKILLTREVKYREVSSA